MGATSGSATAGLGVAWAVPGGGNGDAGATGGAAIGGGSAGGCDSRYDSAAAASATADIAIQANARFM